MLLRAGLIYVLSVLTVLLGSLAAWQHLDIALRDESAAALNKRISALQSDVDAAARREEAAVRRARVAEDSLSRSTTFSSTDARQLNDAREALAIAVRDKEAAEVARSRLEADLLQAVKNRDQMSAERDALERAADEARIAADKALEEAAGVRQDLADFKKAAAGAMPDASVTVVMPPRAVSIEAAIAAPTAAALEVHAPAAAMAADEPIRPASEAAVAESEGQKSALVPNAVTIEPVLEAEKTKTKTLAAKRETAKSETRRTKPKSVAAGGSPAKKPAKQAKKDEPFFPF